MKNWARYFVVGSLIFLPVQSWANFVADIPLSAKVARSDAVLIGRVESIKNQGSDTDEHAVVRVRVVLKGSPPEMIEVITNGPFTEGATECCKIGGSYLFFIRRVRGIVYLSANGQYGIYKSD